MPSSFQYWTGAAWTTENNRVSVHINDTLGFPMYLEVLIANPNSTRESAYQTDYQYVRFVEDRTGEVLFFGRVEKTEPYWHPVFGQCLKIHTRDNLQELLKRPLNLNYTNFTLRSSLIEQIIIDHSYSGNIDTTSAIKFEDSIRVEAANVLDVSYSGSRKNALYGIREIANEDPWENSDNPTGHASDYYLDINADTAVTITADQSFTATLDFRGNIFGDSWFAQTFTPAANHTLNQIRLKLQREGILTGDITVSIRATALNLPTGADLVSATVAASSVSTLAGGSLVTFSTANLAVTAGTIYAIVIRVVGGDIANRILWANRTNVGGPDPYTGGRYSNSANAGGSWATLAGEGITAWTDEYFIEGTGALPATPQMHYFERRTRPASGAVLTTQYGLATETNTARSMLPDYTFDTLTLEKLTQVRCEYVDPDNAKHFVTGILLNCSAFVGTFTPGERITSSINTDLGALGTHNGAGNAASLTDTTRNFLALGIIVGNALVNFTDGSSTTITAITTTTNPNDTLVGVLAGGAENDWDVGDAYRIAGSAVVLKQGSNYLTVSRYSGVNTLRRRELDRNWIGTLTVGATLTGATSGATCTFDSTFRQTNTTDIEVVVTAYHVEDIDEVRRKITSILTKTGTSTGITRGEFRIIHWPRYRLTGTHTGANGAAILTDAAASFINNGVMPGHIVRNTTDNSIATVTARTATTITGTLSGGFDDAWDTGDAYTLDAFVRAGTLIRVVVTNKAINQDMVVEEIDYNEGPGEAHATIKVFETTRGIAATRTVPQDILTRLEDGSFQNLGSSGGTPRKLQPYNTNVIFEGLTYRTLRWTSVSGGLTNGTITWGDSSTQTVTAANSAVLADSTTYYAYIDSSTDPTAVTVTSTYSDVFSGDRVLLAIIVVGQSGSGLGGTGGSPTILPFYSRVPTISAVAIAANSITASRLETSLVLATTIIAGAAGGARVDLSSAGIRAYNATPTQTLNISTAGLIEIAGSQILRFTESIGGAVNGYIWGGINGGVSALYITSGASTVALSIGTGGGPVVAAGEIYIQATKDFLLESVDNAVIKLITSDLRFNQATNTKGIVSRQNTDAGAATTDDTLFKRMRIVKRTPAAGVPTSTYIAFANNPGADTFYLILENA